jgi:beta-xylosidase
MRWRERHIMFYAARARGHGKWCLSVAVAATPAGPFTDRSDGPLVCQTGLGGSIDPHPFVDADGNPWLHWKNNDGSTADVSRVWAAPLGPGGTTVVGPAREVMAKDTQRYPWQHTLDNPQMVLAGGVHYLFFTGGDWEDDSYAQAYAVCDGPAGPCRSADQPILVTYGTVAGPGGGTVEIDREGRWWLAYHAWHSSCTNDACGGVRRLYVAPLEFR